MRRTLQLLLFASFLALATSCGNEPVDQDARFLVLDWNADSKQYEVIESEIETIDSVETASGAIAEMRGGGDIVTGASDPQTEEEYKRALLIEDDESPSITYEVEGGVVEAWDFHGFLMLTLYHHLEKAAFYFEEIGVDRDTVGRLPVYYAPELNFIIPINLLTDNAAYAFTLDAFLIPPQFVLEDVPLSANRGVIVHEYSHAVFNRLVHNDARAPAYLLDAWDDPSSNRMRALDEGVADIFAALALEEPNFISPSISGPGFDIDRDLAKERFYTSSLRNDVETTPMGEFNPYELGSVVASTVWALRGDVDDQRLGEAMVATLRDFSAVGEGFDLTDFFDLLHANLPPASQADACAVFEDRLTVIAEDLQCAR